MASAACYCLELLAAIEERTIPALESAIQEVKDHDVIQQLKYECERALELLNRLMKIEHMKYMRLLSIDRRHPLACHLL